MASVCVYHYFSHMDSCVWKVESIIMHSIQNFAVLLVSQYAHYFPALAGFHRRDLVFSLATAVYSVIAFRLLWRLLSGCMASSL